MRQSLMSVLVVAAVVALACFGWPMQPGPSAAQPPLAGPPPMDGPPGGFRLAAPPLLDALDANDDGELAGDEIAGAASNLATLDKDKNDELSDAELGSLLTRQGRGPGGMAGPGGSGGRESAGPGGFGGRGGPGGPDGFGGRTQEVLGRFDGDKNGVLSQSERAQARTSLAASRQDRGGMFGRGPGGPFGGPEGDTADGSTAKPGPRLSPDEVTQHPDAGLYDPRVLRTLFFVFENQDWEQELEAFHNTDVEVPATLIVDGQTYSGVGMRFRGGSSYGVPRGKKRSFNVTMDLVDKKQRLLGYKTLNLLNSHTDPSFLRTVLYDHIARQYVPAPQANLVRVVINGESWGVYVNEEQFNKDFARTWFGEDSGARWKVPPNFSGAAALVYHGDNIADYRGLYELKSKDDERSWRDLIGLCRALEQLPDEQLETDLDRVLNVDRALWFLALDNVLMDEDGYFSRGSDYVIYQDARHKRFHVLPHDSNETFRTHGGPDGPGGRGRGGGPGGPSGGPGGFPGPGGGPDPMDIFSMLGGPGFGPDGFGGPDDAFGPPGGGFFEPGGGPGGPGGFGGGPGGPGGGPGGGEGGMQEPLSMIQNRMRPLIRRLLSNDHLRARYLAHVQTIVEQSLNWETWGPVFEDYRALIAGDVLSDTHNLATFADFFDADLAEPTGGGPFGAPIGIKRFVDQRREYLLQHADLARPRPEVLAVAAAGEPQAETPVRVVVQVGPKVPVEAVLLYVAVGQGAPFQPVEMKAEAEPAGADEKARTYAALIPKAAAGSEVSYYVEARAESSIGTTAFCPARAEMGAMQYRVGGPATAQTTAGSATLTINEVMASNTRTVQNLQGQFADWIELVNTGSAGVDLTGLYLTDDRQNPRKWIFPAGTALEPGKQLIVWADEDAKASSGLHANFKLSRRGESLLLVDSDSRSNAVLDAVDFPSQRDDISWGRSPDGQGPWQPLEPTPGKPNSAP